MALRTLAAAPHSIVLPRARFAWPSLIETVVALAAIAAILPWFSRVAHEGVRRDDRFAAGAVPAPALPALVLRTICASHGELADTGVRERLCGGSKSATPPGGHEPMPAVLADARAQIARAFADARRQSLACAFEHVAVIGRSPNQPGEAGGANAVLLLAAAVDGHPAASTLAASATLPAARSGGRSGCTSMSLREALSQSASLMAKARAAAASAEKDAAMRDLFATAGWQWSAWMLAGLLLIKLARTRLPVTVGVAIAWIAWALAAWAGRVPWPLAPDRMLALGRVDARWDAMPAGFVIGLVAAAAVLLAIAPWLRKSSITGPQTLASRTGYAGFAAATGIGWLLLLDLSANGPPANRYLALYHHGHLWLAMLVLTTVAFVRPAIGRALASLLSVVDELGGRIGRLLGSLLAPMALALVVIVLVGLTGALLTGVRQVTSELGRLWLIVGVAWFFFLRGAPVPERLARSGNVIVSLLRYAWPLLFVAVVLVGTMLATRDMGPLLIASYAAGAFLAASIAMWWHRRDGAVHGPAIVAVGAFAAWIAAITFAVFRFGAVDDVTAGRLENLAAPLASVNDQLALVGWFREAAPASGYGLGAVPWCGFASASSCAGVPAQIQSDYTFTALVGAFGETAAWAITLGCAVWLHRLIRHHGRVTRGEPRFVRAAGRIVADHQALLSWIGFTWVVLTLCQLAVTVAGNLAVLPLTGVTFPFVSFGMTSLVVNAALFALCVSVTLQDTDDG